MAAEPVAPDELRRAMRQLPTGVAVVTCVADGVDHAMTASAFTSVSLEPPLVLVCVRRTSRFHAALARATYWGVSFLAEDGEAASRWFAQSGRPLAGQLEHFEHTRGPTGVALLGCALAHLECRTTDVFEGGDHDVVLGEVVLARTLPGPRPLLHWDGGYWRLGPQTSGPALRLGDRTGEDR